MPPIQCRHLNPCFPHRVVRLMSQRDRRLYVFFHVCLWIGVLLFAVGTGIYAATRTYAFFIVALPCICVMFVGQCGFRWLALKNEDKFEVFYPTGGDPADELNQPHPQLSMTPVAPPPPAYTEAYDGPIFTIDGMIAPPPEYEECVATAGQQPKNQRDAEAELQRRGTDESGCSTAAGEPHQQQQQQQQQQQ